MNKTRKDFAKTHHKCHPRVCSNAKRILPRRLPRRRQCPCCCSRSSLSLIIFLFECPYYILTIKLYSKNRGKNNDNFPHANILFSQKPQFLTSKQKQKKRRWKQWMNVYKTIKIIIRLQSIVPKVQKQK